MEINAHKDLALPSSIETGKQTMNIINFTVLGKLEILKD